MDEIFLIFFEQTIRTSGIAGGVLLLFYLKYRGSIVFRLITIILVIGTYAVLGGTISGILSYQQSASANLYTIMIIVPGLSIIAIIGFSLYKWVVHPLNNMVTISEYVAQRDLTQAIPEWNIQWKDELNLLHHSMIQMRDELITILQEIDGTAGQLHTNSEEMSSAIEEVSAGMNNVTQVIGDFQQRMLSEMEQFGSIRAIMDKFNRYMQTSTESIREASDLITNIAQQTNILSLNAAIEAARAGEYGRGFAVVADNVRRLSDESHHASEEISRSINEILLNQQTNAENLLNAVSEFATTVEETSSTTEEVVASVEEQSAAMEEITAGVSSVTELAQKLRIKLSEFKLPHETSFPHLS